METANTKNILLLLLLGSLLYVFMTGYMKESFDSTNREFVPVGHDRYGLRGDLIRRSDISNMYLNPNRNIRLHHSSNWMYPSNSTPCQEGISGCTQTDCPCGTDEYDNNDTCWSCGSAEPIPMRIPKMHPHVPN